MAVLAIDVQGGDFGPSRLFPAVITFFSHNPQHQGHVFGHSADCATFLQNLPSNLRFQGTDQRLPADTGPAHLIRHQYHSSLEKAFQCHQHGQADALVSADHTGLLMALMHRHAVTHPAIERPVLVSWVPTVKRPLVMLDLGASFSATAEQLLGFAAIGQAIVASKSSLKPRLALLNLGVEANKGPQALRLAAAQLSTWPGIDYCGFVEANEVFSGALDVVVTDGFTGNAVIKAAEGTLDLTLNAIREELSVDWLGRLFGLFLGGRLKPRLSSLDPRRHNGALLAGTELTVIKSHGHADSQAFQAALSKAIEAIECQWSACIRRQLDQSL
ncbi:MAG: phosphate acyltransferase [Saccharospirillum sp.]